MTRRKRPPRSSDDYQVGPGIVVGLVYEVFDGEGEHVGGSEGEREIVFGMGELLPALEAAIEGLAPGDEKSVRLKAADAYGERDPRALVELDREEFPDAVAPGDVFSAEGEGGATIALRVLDVDEERVVVDGNHPLAGQKLRVDVTIRRTRPASAEELAHAERALAEHVRAEEAALGDGDGGEGAPSAHETGASRLIPPARLLLGPTRRYESGRSPGPSTIERAPGAGKRQRGE